MNFDLFTYIFYTIFILLTLFFARILIPINNYIIYSRSVNNSKVGFYVFVLSYALIIGLRFDVGIDYSNYSDWYETLVNTGHFPIEKNNDFGYVWLNHLLFFLNSHVSILFITLALLQILFFAFAIQKIHFLRTWILFFFFTCLIFFFSMNIMRQMLAFFIFFYALNMYFERKITRCFILFVLAFSFHKTVLVLFVLLPLIKFDWYKKRILQLGLFVASIFVLPLFFDLIIVAITPLVDMLGYNYYIEAIDIINEATLENKTGSGLGLYLFYLVDLLIIIFSNKLKTFYSRYNYTAYFNLYFTGIILNVIFSNNFILARITEYFVNFRMIVLAFLCFYLWKHKDNFNVIFGKPIVILIVLAFIIFFYRALYNNAAQSNPYQFISL